MSEGKSHSPQYWLEEHGDALYRYAMLHTRDPHRAEDAVQETLLAALQSRDRFTGSASVRTWLIGILKHKIMDMFRRDARELYDKLRGVITPLFYQSHERWSELMRSTITFNASFFNTHRMVQQYTANAYV